MCNFLGVSSHPYEGKVMGPYFKNKNEYSLFQIAERAACTWSVRVLEMSFEASNVASARILYPSSAAST